MNILVLELSGPIAAGVKDDEERFVFVRGAL